MGDLDNVRAVLRPLVQPLLELFQGKHTETEHLPLRRLVAALGLLAKSLEDVAEGDAKSNAAHELLLDELAEKDACDSQFLLRILGEEAILIEEVVDHASKNIVLSGVARGLELLEHLDDLVQTLLGSVNLLEILVGHLLDIFGGAFDCRAASRGAEIGGAGLERRVGVQTSIDQCLGAVANLDPARFPSSATRRAWDVLLQDGIVKASEELK
mmetsp:Transcript_80/g.225  ORF Transcript_80/g.225 Transcript_80/m.225 type:complete len:213 (-) Transcript_80:70-708(-)